MGRLWIATMCLECSGEQKKVWLISIVCVRTYVDALSFNQEKEGTAIWQSQAEKSEFVYLYCLMSAVCIVFIWTFIIICMEHLFYSLPSVHLSMGKWKSIEKFNSQVLHVQYAHRKVLWYSTLHHLQQFLQLHSAAAKQTSKQTHIQIFEYKKFAC